MEQRETKEIVTTNGHTAVMYTYITGMEKRAISEALFGDVQITPSGKDANINGFKGSDAFKAENKAMELVVVSVDGKTDDVVNSILNLRVEDSDDIIRAINEVTEGKKKG
jgi:hypothetical protein